MCLVEKWEEIIKRAKGGKSNVLHSLLHEILHSLLHEIGSRGNITSTNKHFKKTYFIKITRV